MQPALDLPPFPGFRREGFDFLRDLAQHNDRDWFKPRKETYDDELKWPMECLLADAAREAARRGLPLTADPKRSLFRIYRDTRFSKNKAPYKTHVAGVMSRSGSRKEPGGLYLHVAPGACFLAAGFWRLDAKPLRAWREHMANAPADFLAVRAQLEKAGVPVHSDEQLKRMPRGFEGFADSEVAEPLRWKSFLAERRFDDEALQTPAFTEAVVDFAADVEPLLRYGWQFV